MVVDGFIEEIATLSADGGKLEFYIRNLAHHHLVDGISWQKQGLVQLFSDLSIILFKKTLISQSEIDEVKNTIKLRNKITHCSFYEAKDILEKIYNSPIRASGFHAELSQSPTVTSLNIENTKNGPLPGVIMFMNSDGYSKAKQQFLYIDKLIKRIFDENV